MLNTLKCPKSKFIVGFEEFQVAVLNVNTGQHATGALDVSEERIPVMTSKPLKMKATTSFKTSGNMSLLNEYVTVIKMVFGETKT